MSHGAPEPGDLLDARYRLGPRLGTGGMGAVYRAEQLSIGRSVAIKLLHETGKDDGYRRFVEEARSASALQHPHIVEVYDFGRADDGTPYLVMELVDGRPLSTLLAERALGRRDALTVALQVWTALQAAHALGIVHADVKPANIMVGERVGVGVVAKLVDFGIARSATSDDRRIVGSPRYMAPEQFRGHAVDGRADIYALGVVLHEMVTGRPPFEAPTPAEYARAHLEQTPGDLPDDALGDLVRQCLSKHPWQRPTTPDALRRLLQDLDDAEPLPSSTAGEETHDFTAGDTAEASLDVGSRIVDADGVAWVIRQVQLRDARRLHVVAEHDGELRRFVRLHDPDAPGWELELWRDRWLTRLAAIDPTHLCALDRAWWDHDAWVLSGPLLVGRPLTELGTTPTLSRTLAHACDLLEAVVALHDAAVVHGGLSPESIRRDDGLRLVDPCVGLLRRLGSGIRTTGVHTGAFLAPEQLVDDGQIGPALDVYAAGAVVAWLQTGRAPHGDTPMGPDLLARKLWSPDAHGVDHPALGELVTAMLQARPDARPDARTALQRLRRLRDDHARPPVGLLGHSRALLDDLPLDAVAGGKGEAWALHGPDGVGRTTMLDQIAQRARRAGLLVLRARATPGALPLALVQALYGHLDVAMTSLDLETAARLEASTKAAAGAQGAVLRPYAHRFEEWFRTTTLPPWLPPERERERLLDTLASLPGWLAETVPVVLLLDDVHFADGPSLAWLDAVVARVSTHPVWLVTAGREPASGRPIQLQGLATAELGQLVPHTVDGPTLERLAALTKGLPGAVVRVVAQLGDTPLSRAALDALPIARRELDLRLDALLDLPETTHPTLAALGVADEPLDPRAIADLLDGDVDTVVASLVAASRAGVVDERAGKRALEHPELRHAACSLVHRDRLAALHRAAASRLVASPDAHDRALRIGHHLTQTTPAPGDVVWLRRAARTAVAAVDGARGVVLADHAIALTDDHEAVAELQLLAAHACLANEALDDAVARLALAHELATEPGLSAELAAERVLLLDRVGQPEAAAELLDATLASLGWRASSGVALRLRVLRLFVSEVLFPGRPAPRARREENLARLLGLAARGSQDRDRGRVLLYVLDAVRTARRGAPSAYAVSTQILGAVMTARTGYRRLGERIARRADPLLDAMEPPERAIALAVSSLHRMLVSETPEGEVVARSRRWAAVSGRTLARHTFLRADLGMAMQQGRTGDMLEVLGELSTWSADGGERGPEHPAVLLGQFATELRVESLAAPALRLVAGDTRLERPVRLRATGALATVQWRLGEHAAAIEQMDRYVDALADVDEPRFLRALQLGWFALLVSRSLAAGDVPDDLVAEATGVAHSLVRSARGESRPYPEPAAAALAAEGYLLLAAGDTERARRRLRRRLPKLRTLRDHALVRVAEALLVLALLEGGRTTPTGRALLDEAEDHGRRADAGSHFRNALAEARGLPLAPSPHEDAARTLAAAAFPDGDAPGVEGPLFAELPPRTPLQRLSRILRVHGTVAVGLFFTLSLANHLVLIALFATGMAPASWVSAAGLGAGVGAVVAGTVVNRMMRPLRVLATLAFTPTLGRLLGRRVPKIRRS